MPKELPSPELLRKLLRYEPDTGELFWRKRSSDLCGSEAKANSFNAQFAGKQAITVKNREGYLYGTIFRKHVAAHRVAWAIYYGKWPAMQIDHINGVKADNRIANLRDVSRSENGKNKRMRSDNTSGVTGVCWVPSTKKWISRIHSDGKNVSLGTYENKEDAIRARRLAEVKYGYHENHGLRVKEYGS